MNKKVLKIAIIGVMSAFAFILYFFEVSVGFILPQAAFLTVDFSDVPAIISTLIFSPIVGTAVELIKNILHFMFIRKDPGISGELANFMAGVSYLIPVYLVVRDKYSLKRLIIGMILGTILSTLMMVPINYFITMEIYGIPTAARLGLIVSTFTPYNIVKGIMLTISLVIIYPRLHKLVEHLNN